MKYAIISDIHANEQALRAVLADAHQEGADRIVCLGDVVGYGPLPDKALHLIHDHCAIVIAGNHDDVVSGRMAADSFIDLACDAVQRHREALDREDLSWLKTLPYTAEIKGAVLSHGDFTEPQNFNYIDNIDIARANFETVADQLLFVGHTHVPGVFLTGYSGAVYRIDPQDFTIEDGKRYIVNPGSVGYPREADGKCYSSYVLYDTDEKSVVFRFLPFSVASVMQRGPNPKHLRNRFLVLGSALITAAAGIVLFISAPKTEITSNITNLHVEEDPALEIERRPLTLSPHQRSVRSNLEIKRGGNPVFRRIRFLGADNSELGRDEKTVKQSDHSRVKIPEGTVSAEFILRKLSSDQAPVVKAFSPSAE